MEFKVFFVDYKIASAYQKLKDGTSEDRILYSNINKAIEDLKKGPQIGIRIPKKLIPKYYIQKYEVNNLWKYDLPGAWRLIYSISGDKIEIRRII